MRWVYVDHQNDQYDNEYQLWKGGTKTPFSIQVSSGMFSVVQTDDDDTDDMALSYLNSFRSLTQAKRYAEALT